MTWEALHLPLVLLLFASGSWAQVQENELVWAVQQQGVSVKCPSTPPAGEYENKIWCKETKPGYCLKLVTSTRPQVMAQNPPHFIWDNPSAGFFIVIVTEITKKSSGTYWCGIDRGPKESIYILKNISLVVTSMTTGSTFISDSDYCLGSSPPSSPFSHSFLGSTSVMLLCAFLVTKILALTALLLFLTYRAQVSTRTMGVAAMAAPSPTRTREPLGTPH
ncbi:natural cytotoxicity triggering receptor 2-like isoform X1 [Eumetopias jubatus]|uniref:natural cytotoxicity triggering receptor 2-like isoform X1 n=1 Tax=Eumetopias jubatus TaxID=34886 RepID=UPI001015D528|nr:natural cytotoxicity triggering receptor 2-like isoform X1 [Eumetopias jubatus]